ncbi:MAG: peptide ABC transporter substrate-binding protein, partial [Oscillospiraceae bacterium]
MKKLIALLLASTFALTALAGCGEKEGTGTEEGTGVNAASTLTWNLVSEPKTIDPTINQAVDGGHVINHTFEGLYRETQDGFVPGVALSHEKTENEDGTTTYTFKLREDAKWSDGQIVTANDFVFSWRRAANPKTGSAYSYIMAPIVNATEVVNGKKDPSELAVKAVDDSTLEVTLVKDVPYFIELTTFPTYAPLREDIVGDNTDGTWAKDPAKAISNGPYVLTNYVMGDHLDLEKNANYWNIDNITVDKLVGKMITESGTILA